MHIYLQDQPRHGEHPKYCQLLLEEDLFGGWCLVRESGQRGTRPVLKRTQFLAYEPARQALETLLQAQLKRGFRILKGPGAPVDAATQAHATA